MRRASVVAKGRTNEEIRCIGNGKHGDINYVPILPKRGLEMFSVTNI